MDAAINTDRRTHVISVLQVGECTYKLLISNGIDLGF